MAFLSIKVEKVCDLVFKSRGIYSQSYSNLIDKASFEDLSDEFIYYGHREIKKGEYLEVLNYDIKTNINPLDFIFSGNFTIKFKCSIKYKGRIYKSASTRSGFEEIRAKAKFENWNLKIYYEFQPI